MHQYCHQADAWKARVHVYESRLGRVCVVETCVHTPPNYGAEHVATRMGYDALVNDSVRTQF